MEIKTSKPEILWESKSILGEGPLWVKEKNSIYFVDIKKKLILKYHLTKKQKKIYKINKEIGFLSHIKKNIFILGLRGELRILNIQSGKIIKSIKIEKSLKYNRINDGKVDTQGNLWFGTMDNKERNLFNGSLYCLNRNLKLIKVDTKYIISNGPAFINKNELFHTDTRKRIIYKLLINNKKKIISKKIFLKFKKKIGSPDGMTLDENLNLWVCFYRTACIQVFDKYGKKKHKLNLMAKNITNCTFGGVKNKDLFITSAIKGTNKKDLKIYKFTGSLFRVKTNMKGIKTNKFKIKLND